MTSLLNKYLKNNIKYQKKCFSILNIKQNTNTTDLTKLISNKTKKCQLNNITELGQPAYWTHPHLFNSNNETNTSKQEVTPGITKQEFEERRDNYVKYLTNYQMFYFSSRFSKSEKEGLKSKKPADWLTTGYDNLTIDKNFITIIPSSMTSFMAPDVPYTFRQNSDFLYLTGFKEPNSILVISKTNNSNYKTAIFVREKNPKVELWEGPCTGPSNIKNLCGIENAYLLDDFKTYLNSLVKEVNINSHLTIWRYPTNEVLKESGPNCNNNKIENDLDEFIQEQTEISTKLINMNELDPIDTSTSASYFNSSRYFVQLCRLKKSKTEIDIMQQACNISSDAFLNSMKLSHSYINEHLIHSKFDYDCKIRGADYLAYIPVIAGGPRATTLHYIRNNQIVQPDNLLLMDAGCQFRDYSSDITRTWPVSGKFNSAQRDLYTACLNVQQHCLEFCKPGINIQKLYNIMMRKLSEELTELGLIERKDHEAAIKLTGNHMDRLPFFHLKKLMNFCPHDVTIISFLFLRF